MKKIAIVILSIFWLAFFATNFADASGCFHDALNKDAHYEKIKSGVRVRNVACMYGSDVMATIGGGTIVKVIAYNPYRKQIEMTDGRVGWIGSQFAERTNQTATIPCSGIIPGDYCDTTNLARCPIPSPQGVEPERTTRVAPAPYNCSTSPVQTPDPTPTPTYTPPVSKVIPVTDSLKPKLDMMASNVVYKVDTKYGSNTDGKITHYKTLIKVLKNIQSSSEELQDLVWYLITKFEETLAMLELENLLDVN